MSLVFITGNPNGLLTFLIKELILPTKKIIHHNKNIETEENNLLVIELISSCRYRNLYASALKVYKTLISSN